MGDTKRAMRSTTVRMDGYLFAKMDTHRANRGLSRNRYLVSLIEADLGHPSTLRPAGRPRSQQTNATVTVDGPTTLVDVELSPSSPPEDLAKSVVDLPKVIGFRWADVEDPRQLAIAKACWAQDFGDDYPSVFPFAGSSQQAGHFDPSAFDAPAMWDLVRNSLDYVASRST